MAIVDFLSGVGEYFKTRLEATKDAYGNAWANTVPENLAKMWSGFLTMSMAWDDDKDSFAKGVRLYLDGAFGAAGGGLTGTIGGAFELPLLYNVGWGLDKAYRYAFARPVSYTYTTMGAAALAGVDAHKRGDDPLSAYLAELWHRQPVGELGIWNPETERVTPGQAIVWAAGGLVGATFSQDREMEWLRTNDPRTLPGQERFNSPEASTWLKYTSGTLDFVSAILGDPTTVLGVGAKAALARKLQVATPKYISRGGVEKEISSGQAEELYRAALNSDNVESFVQRTMRRAPYGGRAGIVLWPAAIVGRDVFMDVYRVARGIKGLPVRGQGDVVDPAAQTFSGSWARLEQNLPNLILAFPRLFSSWDIGADAIKALKGDDYDAARTALRDVIDKEHQAFVNYEHVWGDLPGSLVGAPRPKPTRLSDIRIGTHWNIIRGTPINFARLDVAKPARTAGRLLMPSQGIAPLLDLMDRTVMGVRQFVSAMERGPLPRERVEYWASLYQAANTENARGQVYLDAEAEGVKLVAERNGLEYDTVVAALPEIARNKSAARGLVSRQRLYSTEHAARLGAAIAAKQIPAEGPALRAETPVTARDKRGDFGASTIALPNYQGITDVLQLTDTRVMPALSPNIKTPQLVTQTERWMPTIDLRALDAQIKYWKWRHHPEASLKGAVLANVARVHTAWDSLITASDFAQMVWKSSALLRPAQAPRNIADDVLRRMLIWGKLPLIMATVKGTQRMIYNAGQRGKLAVEMAGEVYTKGRIQRSAFLRGRKPYVHTRPGENKLAGIIGLSVELLDKKDIPGALAVVGNRVPDILGMWARGHLNFSQTVEAFRAWSAYPGFVEMPIGHDLYQMFAVGDWDLPEWRERGGTYEGPVAAPKTQTPSPATETQTYIPTPEETADKGSPWWVPEGKEAAPPGYRWIETQPDRFGGRRVILSTWLSDPRPKPESRASKAFESELRKSGEAIIPDTRTRLFDELTRPLDDSIKGIKRAELVKEFKRRLLQLHFGARGEEPFFLRQLVDQPLMGDFLAELDDVSTIARSKGSRDGHIFVDPITGRRADLHDPIDPDEYDVFPLETSPTAVPRENLEVIKGEDLASIDQIYAAHGLRFNKTTLKSLETFILDNLDQLLRPNHSLSLVVEEGRIRMGVARVKGRPNSAYVKVSKSAFKRMRDFGLDEIRDALHAVPDDFSPAFAFGPEGQAARRRLSARTSPATANLITSDYAFEKMKQETGTYDELDPTSPDYAINWERDVNAELAGDPVARKFLKNETIEDVLEWVQNTVDGGIWLERMHHLGSHPLMAISEVKAQVDVYVPWRDTAEGVALREAVLQRVATRQHLDDAVGRAEQNPIHGLSLRYSLGRGKLFRSVAGGIDRAQQILFDLPTDKWSRFPFAYESYRRHLNNLIPQEVRAEGIIPERMLRKLQEQARERAIYDVRYYLYDTAQVNDLARLMRFVVPFSSAIHDSYLKYGRIARENPATVLQGLYYWEMFERNESVQDENGYVLRYGADGRENWFSVDPATGEQTPVPDDLVGKHRYVQFRLPTELGRYVGRKYYGVDMNPVLAVNKESFNVFIDLPSAGPLVAIAANEFALDNPEFADSKLIQRFVLPFGPSASKGRVLVPANIRAAWDEFTDQDGNTAEAQAKAIFQAELISYARGERPTPPSFVEVREKAAMLKGLRFQSSWLSPVSFQVTNPYQPYVDAYRQLAALDPTTADEKFLAKYGDEFYAVAMTTTRNVAGVRASIESHKSYLRHKDLVEAYPDLAGLIVGRDGGSFSKAVYEVQKLTPLRPGSSQKMRELMSLEESVQDLEARRVWDQFSKLMDLIDAEMLDRGISTLRGRAAQDLAQVRDEFIEANKYWVDPSTGVRTFSPWYNDFTTVDHAAMDKRIESLWAIVQDPDIQKRDDVRGLVEYLDARLTMQERMSAFGLRTLNSRAAGTLLLQWDSIVLDIRERNPEFAVLWSRWLSRDDALSLPRQEAAGAS